MAWAEVFATTEEKLRFNFSFQKPPAKFPCAAVVGELIMLELVTRRDLEVQVTLDGF